MKLRTLGDLLGSFEGTSRRDFLKKSALGATALLASPFAHIFATAKQDAPELFLKQEGDKIIIGNKDFSLDFIINNGNWTNYAPDMYLEPKEDKIYIVGEAKGPLKPGTIQDAQSINMGLLWDHFNNKTGIDRITAEQVMKIPAFLAFLKKSPAYQGWPLQDIVDNLGVATTNGLVFRNLTRFISFNEDSQTTHVLWQLPKDGKIISTLEYWQTASEDGKPKLLPGMKDYTPNLKKYLETENKLIHNPLALPNGVFSGYIPTDFSLKDLNGKDVSLHGYLGKKQAVILNFWATWCGPCREEFPDFQKLYSEREEKNLVLLTVDLGETLNVVKSFMNTHNYNFPVLLDTDEKVSKNYLINVVPQTFIIGRDDKIKSRIIGKMDYHKLSELIR